MSVYCSKSSKYLRVVFDKKVRMLTNGRLFSRSEYLIRRKLNTARCLPVKYEFSLNSQLNGSSFHSSPKLDAIIPFNLTDIGEGIREVVIKEWFVKVGDKVSQFDNICEVQSDKASVTITSRYDGTITKLYYDVDATAFVGKPLVDINTESVQDKVQIQEEPLEAQIIKTLCLPSARRLIKENNLNIVDIKGTGKDGRILKEDVLQILQTKKSEEQPPTDRKVDVSKDIVEPIRGFKKAMIRTMTEALKIPHFVYCDEIVVTRLSSIRKSLKGDSDKAGIKLTLLPFFIKAASNALRKFPILNASVDANCENIIFKSSHNIAVAMNTTVGLAVPVIKNVNNLSIMEIGKELSRLMQSGKSGNFSPEDLTGGTFTVSNIGAIGGTYASPVILPPQLAIIAVGKSKILPRFDSDNKVVAEEIVNVSGSADHRVVDGATMAHFINSFKEQLENPYLLLLH